MSPEESPNHKLRTTFKAEPFTAEDKNYDIDLRKINHKHLPKLKAQNNGNTKTRNEENKSANGRITGQKHTGSIVNPHARYQQ